MKLVDMQQSGRKVVYSVPKVGDARAANEVGTRVVVLLVASSRQSWDFVSLFLVMYCIPC